MKYYPSNTVYKKYFKIRRYKKLLVNKPLYFGKVGIKALTSAFITHIFLEKLHMYIRRRMKKKGKVWFRCIPHIGITQKPLEVRMGKGKGPHFAWVYHVKKGQIFLEFINNDPFLLNYLLRAMKMKLPFKTKIVWLTQYT